MISVYRLLTWVGSYQIFHVVPVKKSDNMKVSNLHLFFVYIPLALLTTLISNSASSLVFNTQDAPEQDLTYTWNSYLTYFFTPEGHKMLEKMNEMPRERQGRTLYLSVLKDHFIGPNRDKFYHVINRIDISDSDDENDDEEDGTFAKSNELHHESVLVVYLCKYSKRKGQYINTDKYQFKLNKIRIKGALFFEDFNRLKDLVINKKFRTLTSDDKKELFQLIITIFSRQTAHENRYKILKLFLNYGFAAEFTPEKWDQNSFFRRSSNNNIPFIKDQRAAEILLAHDKDFFKKDRSQNYIEEFITSGDYDAAKRAIAYGMDPSISSYDRNALDSAIASWYSKRNIWREHSLLDRKNLSDLIKILKQVPGLTESMTYANFQRACEENNLTYAFSILVSDKLEPGPRSKTLFDDSPLESALCTNDRDLIRKASEIFLDKMDEIQLESCLSGNYRYFKDDTGKSLTLLKLKIFDSIANRLDHLRINRF